MRVYDCSNYRQFVKGFIESKPAKGRGIIAQMASYLNVHSTLMSLILSGKRELSLEQACELIEYMDLTDHEGDYFLLLVEIERAGTQKLKKRLQLQLNQLKSKQSAVGSQLQNKKVLSEKEQAQFYSHWLYSGIRLYCTLGENGKSLEEIAEYFQLSRSKSLMILEFLTASNLVKLEKNRYKMGEQKTYVGPHSPFLLKHHTNWRLKSLQKMNDISSEEMMVSSPFSISKKDFSRIKEMLLQFVSESSRLIQDSNPEDIACFNLDLFWLKDAKGLK